MALSLSAQQIASNIDSELNTRGLSLRGDDYMKLLRLRRVVEEDSGKEVSETGKVKYKKEFKEFPKLPKRAIPTFRHRVVTLEAGLNDQIYRGRNWTSPSVQCPTHPAMNLMLACSESKDIVYEIYFPKPDMTISKITEEVETLEVASFKKGSPATFASRRINNDDNIFYLINGFSILYKHRTRNPTILASIKLIMIAIKEFNGILNDDEAYEALLKSLPSLNSIILLDFKHHNFPTPQRPKKRYHWERLKSSNGFSLEPPKFFEPFDENAFHKTYSEVFHKWVGKRPEYPSRFKEVKVYYADALDCQVGPCLAIRNDERYEYSAGKWISTTTGLEAEGEQ
ncbi:hypothetical protein BKA61DRAFT_697139 [Leptodontidium sp. MPI-SDFR-AT-0119]|nr:hypothetical protein BKA61DRAFT_697139 [Leptodontidium sp. MPI-SDFR-AT-0119]